MMPGTFTDYIIEIMIDNVATITVNNGKTEKAFWSMLYDQGLIIETQDLRFYANFKYTLKPGFYEA